MFGIEAGRLDDIRLYAIELHNDARLALGRHEEVAVSLESLIAGQPFRERFREQHMLALYRAGRQKEALDAYRLARRTLIDELGVEPGPRLQELERAILRQDAGLAAPRTSPRKRRRLPASPTPLVGRLLEIVAVTGLLARSDVRLVTLTGPGGSGKTRLALAVAEELAPRLRDGAVFVDLSTVADPALLIPTIAEALGVEERDQPVEAAVAEDLRGRAGLLVLDNFEQLLPAAIRVARLLAESPRLLVLVTSRAPLHVSWENEYPVPPLAVPAPARAFTELVENDAVRLFAARARAVDPDFELVARNIDPVAAICRRLDGLPLAIELAAARSKLLPPEVMAGQLDRALPVLVGGPIDRPWRQQTLQATLDWSHALLTEPERSLFARLAVFSGGAQAVAVAEVCGDDQADPLLLLAGLVDHSLLRIVRTDGGEQRFLMLETIREYAADRLDARGEAHERRRRHAQYFTSLAVSVEADILAGADPAPPLHRLESEHDNLRVALAHFHEQMLAEPALRLASSLAYFWRVRAHLSEGRRWLESSLALAGDVEPGLRVKAQSSAGRLAYRQGDYSRARELHEQALFGARNGDDPRAVGQALSDLGGVSLAEGDLERAETLYTESAQVLRACDHLIRLGTVLGNLGSVRLGRSDVAGAGQFFTQALELQQGTGDKEGRVFTHLGLSRVALQEARYSSACDDLARCLALIRELDYREMYGVWFLTCAEVAWNQGDPLLATRLVGAADASFERVGVSRLHADDAHVRATVVEAALASYGSGAVQTALLEGRETAVDDALSRLGRA